MGQNIDNWNYSGKCKYWAFLTSHPDSLITTVWFVFEFVPKDFRSILKASLTYFAFCCDEHQSNVRRRGCVSFYSLQSISEGCWGRNSSRAGTWNRSYGRTPFYVLFSLVHTQPASLYNTGPSAQGWHHTQQAGLSDINQQSENTPDLPTGQSDGAVPLWGTNNSGLCQVDNGSYL